MLLFLATILLVTGAVFANAVLRPATRVGTALGLFVLAYVEVVLISEAASLLGMIGAPFYLAVEALLAGAMGWMWLRQGKPALLGAFSDGKWRIWHELPGFKQAPALWLLGGSVGLIYLVNTGIILLVPPNNYDSLTYHLARVGYWLQHQSMGFWETANNRQIAFPPNAELGILWTAVFSGNDLFSGFIQWICAIGCMIAIFGMARSLGATRQQSLFSSLIWASFPQIILQSTTTQNDLVVTFFVVSGVYFLMLALTSRQVKYGLMSGLVLGLALGTKTTFFFFLPGLAIAVMLWLSSRTMRQWRIWKHWLAFCLVGGLLLGSITYFQNLAVFRNPLGPGEWSASGSVSLIDRAKSTFYNALLYSFQMIDGSGLPDEVNEPLGQVKQRVFDKIFRELGVTETFAKYSFQQIFALPTRLHEDLSWFGPLGFLALIPAIVFQTIIAIKRRALDRLAIISMGGGWVLALCVLMGWTLYKGRYFILFTGLVAPLMAFLYIPRKQFYHSLLAVIAIFVLFYTTAKNDAKPLTGPGAIFLKNRVELRTINTPFMTDIIKYIEEEIPARSVIALKLGENGLDYLFFGESFTNSVIQVDQKVSAKDISFLKEIEADYLVIGPREQFFIHPPNGLELISSSNQTSLYRVRSDLIDKQAQITTAFPSSDIHQLVFTDPSLTTTVGVIETWTGSWPIEQYEGKGFFWFGQGERQGLGMSIMAERDYELTLRVDVGPGPSRKDPGRTLVVVITTPDRVNVFHSLFFSAGSQFSIPIKFQEGVNQVGMYVIEAPDIFSLPDGDPRTLMVSLRKVEFLP